MLSKLNWVDTPFLGVKFGIHYVVDLAVFLEELLVIQEIITWEYTLEKSSPFVF